jgi:geranylgeranyl pyrophosphate synthase
MAAIGSLEGSEEAGVATVLEPERMVDLVHRVRGGALFELAFVAPRQLESSVEPALLDRAQSAISRLGTAFQIVDDLTDFEWDLAHGRHNLLVAQITHRGSQAEQSDLRSLKQGGTDDSDVVTRFFADSAGAVIERGEEEAQASLEELQELGFWFSPGLANQLLRAIVGLEGVARMRAL